MHLKKLNIELQEWGPQKGKYEVLVEYVHERTETKMFLPEDVTKGLLELIAKNIVEASSEVAKRLATGLPQEIIQASTLQIAAPVTEGVE